MTAIFWASGFVAFAALLLAAFHLQPRPDEKRPEVEEVKDPERVS